jgi:DNA invertase Pin-like site-specific DNA recombinase
MSRSRRIGVSYTRFSDPVRQSKGDSQDRQDRMYRDFCNRHNLTPLAEVFADCGRSGYRDEHRRKGRFGQLVAMAKGGQFEPGTVIVVEAWDRLGRLRPDKQTELIAELLRTGVNIGVCRLDDIFTEEDFGTHKWTTLAVFVQLAYQESKQKAERIAESWKKRRENARKKRALVTRRIPAWLEEVNGALVTIPERVAALKVIFRLAADGYGAARIVRVLTGKGKGGGREKAVPPFGTAKWTRPYLNKILSDRRVLGEYQPRKTDDTPDGPPILGYYPQVITEDEYLLARAGRESRNIRGWRRGRDRRHVNVFQSLLTHARDGEGFALNNHGTGERPDLVLVNAAGMDGRSGCWTFPYRIFEDAILGLLREVKTADVLPREQAVSRAEVLRARLENVRGEIAKLQEDLGQGYSKALAAVLRGQEDEEERLSGELQEELARSVRPAARAWEEFPSLVDMLRKAADPNAARLRLRATLRRSIEGAWVLLVRRGCRRLCAVQVYFQGGARRDYLVVYKAAGKHRPGGWSAWSLAEKVEAGDLDLRRPEHALALERLLAEVDLAHMGA